MAKADRTGRRTPRTVFKGRTPDLGYYMIVTDTKETEENYMKGIQNSLPKELQGKLVIKVQKGETKNLVADCKEYVSLHPQHSQGWIVFDRDQVVKFDDIIRDAECAGIRVGWSNPCIEIWFDSYFGEMHPYVDSVACCHGFSEIFRKKTGLQYQKSESKIYELLNRYGDENRAIKIAKQRHDQHLRDGKYLPSEMCPCTTVYRLVNEIRQTVAKAKDTE